MSAARRTLRIVHSAEDPAPLAPDTLLTVKEVAARLKIGTSTVYRMAEQTPPALPVVRFPGTKVVRVSERALEAYIAGQVGR